LGFVFDLVDKLFCVAGKFVVMSAIALGATSGLRCDIDVTLASRFCVLYPADISTHNPDASIKSLFCP
jgi:hypothetical protein